MTLDLDLNLTQLALLRQMADAWRKHLDVVSARARKTGNTTVLHNVEVDVAALDGMMRQLNSRPLPEAEKLQLPAPAMLTGKVIDV